LKGDHHFGERAWIKQTLDPTHDDTDPLLSIDL